jgi:hypothetical protein
MSFQDDLGNYAADAHVAYVRAGWLGGAVAVGWLLVPVAVQTVFHPGDAFWLLQLKLHGSPVPASFTASQLAIGFIEAVIGLVLLASLQLAGTIWFYRRAQLQVTGPVAQPPLWILAAITSGILGNCAWFIGTQAFDLFGGFVGLTSLVLTVGGEMLCESLGREVVFGPALAGPHQW